MLCSRYNIILAFLGKSLYASQLVLSSTGGGEGASFMQLLVIFLGLLAAAFMQLVDGYS